MKMDSTKSRACALHAQRTLKCSQLFEERGKRTDQLEEIWGGVSVEGKCFWMKENGENEVWGAEEESCGGGGVMRRRRRSRDGDRRTG
jgi:hypothetical protein